MIKNKNIYYWISIAVVALSVLTFEAAQQLYFVNLYGLKENPLFLDFFLSQLLKWIIWLFNLIPLCFMVKKIANKDNQSFKDVQYLVLLIVTLLFTTILMISVYDMYFYDDALGFSHLFNKYFIFFMYQKAPIYLLGSCCFMVILYFYFLNNKLNLLLVSYEELSKKDKKQARINQVNDTNGGTQDDKDPYLKIKVGNLHKIIAVKDVEWFESDNYCVNIHMKNSNKVFSLRSTMKKLLSILPSSFIRVHRRAIVNIDTISEYKKTENLRIITKSGSIIPVAKTKSKMIFDIVENTLLHTNSSTIQ